MVGRALVLMAAVVVGLPAPARAVFITDPANDFLPSYLGPHNGDLDVIGAEVVYDGVNFRLHAVLNGAVGTTPGGFYVWGFNRGAGAQGFPTIAPGVLFDRVALLNNNDTGTVAGTPIVVTHSGNELFAVIPQALLPNNGFTFSQYTSNLWPRSPAIPGNALGNIADFAPDNSNAPVSTVPAPAGVWLAVLAGLSAVGWSRFRV